VAIVLEVCGTTSMKLSQGFTKLTPSVLIFVFYGLSFVALTLCLRYMDVSVAYAVWSGLGTLLIAAIGIAYFKEPLTLVKIGSLILIIVGVIGVNLSGNSH
jgi:small multidrug resistance pump